MNGNMTGSAINRLVLKQIRGVALQVPPLAEQRRIADKLDKLLARIDASRERLDQVANNAERLCQSVLAAARSGALSAAWREARQDAGAWQQTTLGEVVNVGTGSTPLLFNPSFFAPDGIAWVTRAATWLRHDQGSQSEHVTDAAVKVHRLTVYKPGTLLVAMYGKGKTIGQVVELAIDATINQACTAIQIDESVMHRYFAKLMLQAHYFDMRDLAEGGNQPNLNLAKVRGLELPLPPLDEQVEICRRAERHMGLAGRMDQRFRQACAQLQGVVGDSLAKAFCGELVPQDPTDQPAQALLDRLRASTHPVHRPPNGAAALPSEKNPPSGRF